MALENAFVDIKSDNKPYLEKGRASIFATDEKGSLCTIAERFTEFNLNMTAAVCNSV